MAAVESLSSADPFDPAQWLVLRGTLRDADLIPLLVRTTAAGPGDVTLDDELHSTGTIGHRYTVFLASAFDDAELAGRTRNVDQPIELLYEARSPTQQLE